MATPLLGVGSLLAAISLAKHLEAHGLPGTVRYYGCPGEEGGSGKTFMVRAGAFDDVDAALTWHPAPFNGVRSTNNLAVLEYYYRFRGTAAHASNAAHLGRSALDAVEPMNVGVNFLREHMPQDCRVHYAITDAGGRAANVVQAKAEVLYLVRAPEMSQALALAERVEQVARGAAMMTGTEVEIVFDTAATNLLPNLTLENAIHENLVAIGPVHSMKRTSILPAKSKRHLRRKRSEAASNSTKSKAMSSPTKRSMDLHRCTRACALSKAIPISVQAPPMSVTSAVWCRRRNAGPRPGPSEPIPIRGRSWLKGKARPHTRLWFTLLRLYL